MPVIRKTDNQMVGFHFMVTFHDLKDIDEKGVVYKDDVRFQSVSGLDVQMETEEWKEGGENRFTHAMPGRSKYSSSLVLKRGLLHPNQSGITKWCLSTFVDLKVKPLRIVSVELLGDNHEVLVKWDLEHVWPKNWKIGELNAERSEVLIETLELHYNRFTYKNP